MSSTLSIDLQASLCSAPVGGSIYQYLFNGGSWFEAEQMHWRLEQEHALNQLQTVVAAKPTKANQEKALSAISSLEECAKQLVPHDEPMALFLKADQVVKTWAPAPKTAASGSKGTNVFAALDEDSEEEEEE
jgi:hypothetical protein